MKLTYIFHSGFALEFDDFAIIIDYFRDSDESGKSGIVHDRLLKSDLPLYVLSTHSHEDHFNPEILKWKKKKKDITYIFSDDILENGKAKAEDATFLKKSDSYNDKFLNVKAFGSTDLGISFYLKAAEKAFFHAGDLNNWHWNEESTAHEIKASEDYYQSELNIITDEIKYLDLAIFPLDPRLGKDFTKGAQQFIEAIEVDILAPMHFSAEPDKIKAFEAIAQKYHCKYICWKYRGESVII